MPNLFDVSDIVVTGTRPSGAANDIMAMWQMMSWASESPSQVVIAQPVVGEVEGHIILVRPSPSGTTKPTLMQTQIDAMRDAFERVGEVVAALTDDTTYQFGGVTMSGAEMKAAYFALTTIEITDDIYRPGYGGENHGNTLYIALTTVAGYNRWGNAGLNYVVLHEMVHNSKAGRAVAQQCFDRHLEAGGTPEDYEADSYYFEMQEKMTNTLTKQIGDQISVSTDPDGAGVDFPKYGYYTGSELIPPE